MNININVVAEVEQEVLVGLVQLIQEFLQLPIWFVNFDFDLEFVVANEGTIPNLINERIADQKGTYIPYIRSLHSPKGTAIPVENENSLSSIIFLEASLIKNFSSESYHDQEAVSTVLEEMLHANMYFLIWKQRGFLLSKSIATEIHSRFLSIASMIHDEYAVNRQKAFILATYPLINNNGKLTVGAISYGASISRSIENALLITRDTVKDFLEGKTDSVYAEQVIHYQIHKGILDPLARNAGIKHTLPEDKHQFDDANVNPHFRNYFLSYWNRIEHNLRKSSERGFTEVDETIVCIAKEVEALFHLIGIEYRLLDDGSNWVDLSDRFFYQG